MKWKRRSTRPIPGVSHDARELSLHTQFIAITHNRETMAQAGLLYGVTMGQLMAFPSFSRSGLTR